MKLLQGDIHEGAISISGLAWPPGEDKKRVGGRVVLKRRQHGDLYIDLTPCVRLTILIDLVRATQDLFARPLQPTGREDQMGWTEHDLGNCRRNAGRGFRGRIRDDVLEHRSEEHTSELQSHSFISY